MMRGVARASAPRAQAGEGAQHRESDEKGSGENQEVKPQARNQAESDPIFSVPIT